MMRRSTITLLSLVLLTVTSASADGPILVVTDADGASGRIGAPVSVDVDLATLFDDAVKPEPLQLVEQGGKPVQGAGPVAAQFVPDSKGSKKGRLWWLMPPGGKGERRFRLEIGGRPLQPGPIARFDAERKAVDVSEDKQLVIRYNQGTVPPPPEIVERFEKQNDPPLYYARGDYIHPVIGPDGESLTDDYSLNHPHHRGICWAWPVVRWKDEVRDIWAVRVLPTQPGGVWARPVSLDRVVAGPVLAAIDAENVWKWGDRDAIVREDVSIRVFRGQNRCRFLDVQIRLAALVDDVSICCRPGGTYGGFNLRSFPEFDERRIDMHVEPREAKPRRAWFHLTGKFPGGKGLAGVAMFEHVTNPDYPSFPNPQNADRVPGEYPRWRSVQPAWPGDREVALKRGEPIVLDYRLWIHPGVSDEATLGAVWASYARPP
ncbi:MAG: PmoA family protein, partial [Planctomycetes bacterium]|nr:PmoA family protein [Planctomycetota bacterium]